MNTQDPELSAALGWPGGISDPALDRTRLLQMVAALRLASQQALEALIKGCNINATEWHQAIYALRAALAESERDWSLLEATQASLREHMAEIRRLRAALAQQAEPLNLSDPAVRKRLASQWGYVPAAAQAEPVQAPGAWVASTDGRVIYDDISADDGLLRVSGDFENDEQRIRYAQRIVDKLNAAPPQRKLVPLTEEEIKTAFHAARNAKLGASQDNSRHRLSVIEIARAVEQALWEKHHG